jgi:hypothetical protein
MEAARLPFKREAVKISTVSQGWDMQSLLWKKSQRSSKAPVEEGSQAIVNCKLGLGQVVSPLE